MILNVRLQAEITIAYVFVVQLELFALKSLT